MHTRLIPSHDAGAWLACLEGLRADAYYMPGYLQAHAEETGARALAFVAEQGRDVLFYPFMVRPVFAPGSREATHCDLESVYGYSGPLANTFDSRFLSRAWAAFRAWCQQAHVVSEFIRFHPFLGTHRYADPAAQVLFDRETVAIPLDRGEAELMAGYPSTHRNNVRRAIANGLTFAEASTGEGIDAFLALYEGTMRRRSADARYYYSRRFFAQLLVARPETAHVFVVRHGDTPIAAGLFLAHSPYLHCHLAANDPAFQHLRPSNMLFHGAARWGQERGLRWLHLGGGRTPSPDDSLFRFKASLSRERMPFYLQKRVHDAAAYARICDDWRASCHASAPVPAGYFRPYHLCRDGCAAPCAAMASS